MYNGQFRAQNDLKIPTLTIPTTQYGPYICDLCPLISAFLHDTHIFRNSQNLHTFNKKKDRPMLQICALPDHNSALHIITNLRESQICASQGTCWVTTAGGLPANCTRTREFGQRCDNLYYRGLLFESSYYIFCKLFILIHAQPVILFQISFVCCLAAGQNNALGSWCQLHKPIHDYRWSLEEWSKTPRRHNYRSLIISCNVSNVPHDSDVKEELAHGRFQN